MKPDLGSATVILKLKSNFEGIDFSCPDTANYNSHHLLVAGELFGRQCRRRNCSSARAKNSQIVGRSSCFVEKTARLAGRLTGSLVFDWSWYLTLGDRFQLVSISSLLRPRVILVVLAVTDSENLSLTSSYSASSCFVGIISEWKKRFKRK